MSFEADSSATAVAVTTSEAVALVSPQVTAQIPSPYGVLISGEVNYTPASSGTALTIKVRQGSTTAGTQVDTTETDTLIATSPDTWAYAAEFPAGQALPFGNQFCVTAQGTGAGGTINHITMSVRAISPTGTS